MNPNPAPAAVHPSGPDAVLRRIMGGMSVFTMLMTIPQVLTIWISQQAAGVSIFTWSAYWFPPSFGYGSEYRNKNIYLPCIGWIVLDTAVIVGVFIYG